MNHPAFREKLSSSDELMEGMMIKGTFQSSVCYVQAPRMAKSLTLGVRYCAGSHDERDYTSFFHSNVAIGKAYVVSDD